MTAYSDVPPVTHWQLPRVRLDLRDAPLLMGIVNVTPDSFSDGGDFFEPQRAVEHALQLAEQGADILDIGGESTRPYANIVDGQEELKRVLPVVESLCQQVSVPISIDTSKAAVAEAALDHGAQIINDVTGLEGDPAMLPLAARSGAAVCAMHMQGTPQTMQNAPQYRDLVAEIETYLAARRDSLIEAGVAEERICLDPGIGFGKTHAHNLELLRRCQLFHRLGCPLLVGHSRKGFIGHVLRDKQADRTAGTIGVAVALASKGVHVLRVHDVAAVRQALLLWKATGG